MSDDKPTNPASLTGWLQQHGVAMIGAALVSFGGGYIGGSQVDSYRLDRIEEQVDRVASDVREMRDALAATAADRWTRSQHEQWERGELRPALSDLETRLRLLEHGAD